MTPENETRLNKDNSDSTRRDFLGKLGTGMFLGASALCAAVAGRSLLPLATPEPSQQLKLGPSEDYPVGTVRNFEDQNVIIFRDEQGIFAISTICTHLGCIVSYDPEHGFECPCHGSTFTADGTVTKGPAPAPLPWMEVSMLPNGQLVVDNATKVAKNTRFVV
ncbi:MAG: ubiquinol-cytochrome c reductase iron-sulfur subunit [bacterium]|nr:ubiquinol-cytochrome c reductase iron-sulfur subunit [bacterium]